MIKRANGVVIKRTNFGNTSQVVCFLTPSHGMVSLLGKGVWRPNNPLFSGGFALGSFYEFMFIPRPRAGLGIITEAQETDGLRNLRKDRRRLADAFFILSFARYFSVQNSGDKDFYSLVVRALSNLNAGNNRVLLEFMSSSLKLAGFSPLLDYCSVCGLPLWEADSYSGDFKTGGIICPKHRAKSFFRLSKGALRACLFSSEEFSEESFSEAFLFLVDWANYVLGFRNAVLEYPFYVIIKGKNTYASRFNVKALGRNNRHEGFNVKAWNKKFRK